MRFVVSEAWNSPHLSPQSYRIGEKTLHHSITLRKDRPYSVWFDGEEMDFVTFCEEHPGFAASILERMLKLNPWDTLEATYKPK